jgi:hypothetical protein
MRTFVPPAAGLEEGPAKSMTGGKDIFRAGAGTGPYVLRPSRLGGCLKAEKFSARTVGKGFVFTT